jgi:exonuclease III
MMAEDYQMRIATWNVESLRKLTPEREAAFHEAMAEVDADVWVLTETWKTFSPGIGYQLAAESSLADDLKTWPDRTWVTVWVKASLAAKSQEVQNQSDRMACCRIVNPGQRDIVVVGTVLPWSSDELWLGDDGFCASLASQSAEWGAMRCDPDRCTLVVAGDFNQAIPYEQSYGTKKCVAALNGAFQSLDLLCLSEGADSPTSKPRIDHICVSRNGFDPNHLPQIGGWAALTVNGKPVTDHSGVYVDL